MINKKSKKNKITLNFAISFCILIFAFCIFKVKATNAASLYVSPSSGSYEVGKTFTVSVYVSSTDQAMNAASGVISFPQDKLEITSLTKSGSIISLWVQEPSFSNNTGVVNFEGIVLNPGFTGASGRIISAGFKVKAAGTGLLTFSSGSILANDGQGTNILTGFGNASFTLSVPSVTPLPSPAPPPPGPTPSEVTTPSVLPGTPAPPQITSPTHPDSNKWYNLTKAKFSWQLPPDATATRLLVGQIPNALPTVTYTPPISSKELIALEEGVWYFHVQLKNTKGWGAVSHFRFQIDTAPPEPFYIELPDGKETTNPKPSIHFEAIDTTSGIDYYKIKIGEGDFFTISEQNVKHNPYTLPPQAPGKRTIIVQTFDKANNSTMTTETLTILPISAPEITEYPQQIFRGQPLIVKGKTYPNSQVTLWLQREKDDAKSQTIKSDQDGNFSIIYRETLKDGVYKIWAEVVDERGAHSLTSEQITFIVSLPPVLKIGKIAIDYLTMIVTFVIFLIGMVGSVLLLWYRVRIWRRRLKKATQETAGALRHAFNALREEVEIQVGKLDKKPGLSRKEKKISDQLKNALNISESFISRELKDIEKELKTKPKKQKNKRY